MHDHPFATLRGALLRMGVAPRHARRVVMELDTHFQQLVDEALARGDTEEAARGAARERLGTEQSLIERYAGMPELRAWSSRWPAAWFTLVPLISFIALFVAAMAALVLIAEQMSAYLHQVHVPAGVSSRIDGVAKIFFLWVLPLAIAAAFARLAYRRRVALHWPVAGIAIVCCLAALINVDVVLTGGAPPGQLGAGIGFSTHALPGQLAHAAAILTLVVGPLWLAWRRHRLDGMTAD
ncbi:MAG TPA: hypothetical protein VKG63_04850 [Steroidobacteraceae bacterium]|nr:hypothetical protein [Steroidobacteraceae bacterium]